VSAPDPTGAATRTAPGRLARGLPVLWQRLVQADEANVPEVFDLVIVGSGYGGSIAAEHFAGAATAAGGRSGQPFKVLLLERGNEYLPGEFPGRFAARASTSLASSTCAWATTWRCSSPTAWAAAR